MDDFLRPGVDDGQELTFHHDCLLGISKGRVRSKYQESILNDLPAVANGTAEHHTEDHPNDLLRGKMISFFRSENVCYLTLLRFRLTMTPAMPMPTYPMM